MHPRNFIAAFVVGVDSDTLDVLGLPAFWALDDVKLDRLALRERSKSFAFDG